MPGKVKVKIVAGRNLPVMDRSSDTTDAYVEIKLGNITFKTDVCRKSLNPQWNSEWYRFEMDDAELQDEPLQIRLMDHDTYSANDAIGKVYLDLNPLLLPPIGLSAKTTSTDTGTTSSSSLSGGNTMSGWFPVYDTMHGIRGEVNVIVKVELFSDFNKFRQSSCGVQFFNSPTIPQGYHAQIVHGMVEELVVSDDPEYHWIDKIRTPRASNEARQTLFFKLSGEVQRRIGLKVLDLGGNAVIGYLQCFDLEAECGIVVRGLGTAVSLVRLQEPSHAMPCQYAEELRDNPSIVSLRNPVLSVIPATPIRQSPCLDPKCTKGLLAPASPRNCRSKSPQLKQPFGEYKPKRLKTNSRRFHESIPECDTISLKVLFEQEDMRGERVSSRKKIFERLSSFPKRKFKAFQERSGMAFNRKVTYLRSKSENVATTLVRSVMDTKAFPLDRVAEVEEVSESKLSDSDSVIHPLRYDDGHLVPISSSSSDSSSSDSGDISDMSSVSTSTQDFSRRESNDVKSTTFLSLNNQSISVDNSISSSKAADDDDDDDDEVDNDDGDDEYDDDEQSVKDNMEHYVFPQANLLKSSVHVVAPDNELNSLQHNQYSTSIKFKNSPSPPKDRIKSMTLVRQISFDVGEERLSSNAFKRSDTPPLSEMDPYIKINVTKKCNSNETLFGEQSQVKLIITQPSLDEELKSRPISNISFPESVRNLPSIAIGHIPNNKLNTKVESYNNNSKLLVDRSAWFESNMNKLKEAEKIFAVNDSSVNYSDKHQQNDKIETPSSKITPHSSETVYKILHNPFEFPTEKIEDKSISVQTLTESYGTDIVLKKRLEFGSQKVSNKQNKKSDLTKFSNVDEINELLHEQVSFEKKLDSNMEIDTDNRMISKDYMEKDVGNHEDSKKMVPGIDELENKNMESFTNEIENLSSGLTAAKGKARNSLGAARAIETVANKNIEETSKLNTDSTSANENASQALLEQKQYFPFNKSTFVDKERSMEPVECKGDSDVNGRSSSFEVEAVSCVLATTNECRVEVLASSTNQMCAANLPLPIVPLVKSHSASGLVSSVPPSRTVGEESIAGLQPVTLKASQSPAKFPNIPNIHRRSSDSDLSITPKGNSLTSSGDRSSMAGGSGGRVFQPISSKLAMKKEPIEVMEFPFLTMNKFPSGFIVNIAGTVTSRSVKLLERVSNVEEPESRDTWWTELRMEVRSHMRAMSCNAVLGYSETTTICDDVCVLSASGTAAVVNVRSNAAPPPASSDTPEPVSANPPLKQTNNMTSSLDRTEFERQGSLTQSTPLKSEGGGGKTRHHSDSMDQPDMVTPPCSVCHLPFNPATVPLPMTAIRCGMCRKKKVPDLLLATIEPLEGLPVIGRSCLIHVFVTRPKQHARGELNACFVSDSLPFIEYDIYKQLVNKLRVNGMNAILGLKTQICLGERMIAAVTSGTAMYLEALPTPSVPTITPGETWSQDNKLSSLLKGLQETVKKNREFYQVKTAVTVQDVESNTGAGSDSEDSDNEMPDMDIHAGNKEACVFMVDDEQDMEIVNQLIDPHPPEGFFVTSTEGLPGLEELEVVRNLQMFTQIWRSRIPSNQPSSSIHKQFHKLLQGIYYKLRRMTPCAVGNVKFRLALPEPDEMQISIVGMAVGLGESMGTVKTVRRRTLGASSKPESLKKKMDEGDMIFSLEEDQESSHAQLAKTTRPKSPVRPIRQSLHLPPKERYGVDMTPLSYIPGGRIEKYLGNLNFFFIRETSCIREGGGMSGFVHSFVAEVLAIIRAHVTALGGNALVAFFLNECVILNNPHKNHGQCLINVGGDAVSVSYID